MGSAHAKNVVLGTYQVAPNECYKVTKIWGGHIGKSTSCTAGTQPVTVLSSNRYSIVREDGASVVGTHMLIMTPSRQVLDVDIPLFAGM